MRGRLNIFLSIGVVAGLCGLAIALSPVLGPLKPATRTSFVDPRWDGEWEHRLPEPVDVQFTDEMDLGSRIENRWLGGEDESLRPILAAAGEVPQDPILRIETEQHSASLRSIDTDAAGRFMVTGADDKTARVWAIPQEKGAPFRLVQVLRPPIGEGHEGKVFAVAMSPDGATIAVGGYTGWAWHVSACVYLFDRASGRLVRSLTGLPGAAYSLAFSKDGRHLAAGLSMSGVRVWRTNDWAPVSVEAGTDYGGYVFGLSFAADGRLATGSYDGFVRLYTADFRLKAKRRALDEDRLMGVAFAPTDDGGGGRLAVASVDRPLISVLSGNDLSELYRPTTSDLRQTEDNHLSEIAWSADGEKLYAAGAAARILTPSEYARFIRRYDAGGRGAFADFPAVKNKIFGLRAHIKAVLFGAADPAFGLMEETGAVVAREDPRSTDMRSTAFQKQNSLSTIRVSSDGLSVSRPFHAQSKVAWRFDGRARRIQTIEGEAADLDSTRLSAPGLQVTGWNYTQEPAANGAVLPLTNDETATALAIAPSGDKFLLGTGWNIRAYNAAGGELWSRPGAATAWQVNITGDGRLAIAAFDDGTVRWFDMENGDELLALFITNEPEGPRWVAWTPSGYYDASPGAEDLIGWHINQGAEKESLFFQASRFRDLYYRPGIAERVLKSRQVDPPPSRQKLLAVAPPIVTILDQRTLPNGDVVVDYEARTIFGESIEIEVFVDDAKLDLEGARVAVAPSARQSLTVPRGSCADSLAIVATTNDGRRSDAAVARAMRVGSVCDTGVIPKPKLHAVIIGVSAYADKSLKLNYAHQDAEDFAAMIEAQKGGAYEDVKVTKLLNENATKDNIQTALEALLDIEDATSNDVTILFFAGHGAKVERASGGDRTADLYLVSHNANMNSLASTAVNASRLIEAVKGRVGRKFVFLDACYSNFSERSGLGLFDMQGIANTLGGSDIRAEVFSSSTGDQVSFEKAAWKNGAFTEALLEGLGGEADYEEDKRVTNDELNLYVKRRVSALTGERQTPTYTAAGSVEFSLAHVGEQ